MEAGNIDSNGGQTGLPSAAVVSKSPLMRKRIGAILAQAGFAAVESSGTTSFVRQKRQRPYVVTFLDVRGAGGCDRAAKCFEARPGERYVLISESRATRPSGNGRCQSYGCVQESFTTQDILDWAARAAAEERLSQGEQPLEDLLLEKFRSFSHQMGNASMTNLHGLVMERVERPLFRAVLEWTGGNQSRASEILGIHRNTLRARLKALGLEK
ncbi:hypothetical protein FDZ71_03385 [bacterium]|nr:MAG: hypothetical protein FDZ71_03385 [bacterium]